ncbi:MAG: glycoside hydrolase family 43 protein [Prolixibacteraceae bacterium]|nr:glycoside hydrolase family 43 protein [Prolixibacteraceae bacterium]
MRVLIKKHLSIFLYKFLILTGISAVALSCTQSNNKISKEMANEKSVVFFDNFTYSGNDDFYVKNALPGEDYFYNPILPGWYSDPSICTNGKDFFLVTSTFVNFPGVPIFHSTDLVNWKQIGHVLSRESQLINMIGQHTSGGIFAPAISYNPHNETYYMITTNVGAGNFFVKTKNPFGEWSDPIMLPEVQGIDPSFFFDVDGKAYIVNNDAPEGPALYDGHRAIRIQEFDVETEKTFGPRKVLVNGGIHFEDKPVWIEGPHIYNINGKYFLMAAEGGTSVNHSEVILRGDSPMGPYKAWDKNPILTQRHLDPSRPEPITCAGHADLAQTAEGDWWSVFLACRPIDGKFENLGRETFLLPVRWSEDGFPYMTQGDEEIPMIVQKKGITKNSKVTFGNFSVTENFDSTKLSMEWMTMRTPAKDMYSLTDHPGYISIKCSENPATEMKTPAFVCRRIQHHKFECSTDMYFNPADEKETAGLLLYKDEKHQYFFSTGIEGEQKYVSLNKVSKDGTEVIAKENIGKKADMITMTIKSSGTNFSFYYSTGDIKSKLLADNVDAFHLSTANSFGFTGTTIGMYAVRSK